ncbi:MAG: TonB-dependent receptor plug domain-containing protein, partial [Methylococcales bacterium]|nr:TonB-dependent receptor plug domain-containing protein [Methylococcales bacterium]
THHSQIKIIIYAMIIFGCGIARAEQNLTCKDMKNLDVEDVSIEQLMEIPIFFGASQQAACTKEAANIVNSISGEQILTSGARDLVDVLRLIPGFTFGVNMTNEIGVGIRGIQADEGKMSVFVDGIMLTERRFGTTAFGGRFPIENIDRIEIIRGSSSITNGNFAEMGVINIITKNAKQADGLAVTTDYGRFERGEARKNINVTAGKIFDEIEVSFSGKANESQRSDRIYTDAHQNSFDMANNSQLASLYGNLGLKYKDFKIRLLSDEYNIESLDGFADAIAAKNTYLKNEFNTYAANLNFEHEFNPNFKVNSEFDFSRQSPWERSKYYSNGTSPVLQEKVLVDHYKFDIKATWITETGSYFALGNTYKMDDYSHIVSDFKGTLPLFTDYTAYAEGVYKTGWVDILAGLRFDAYGQFGTNFAPRLAFTKQFEKFHYKLLYTHAFHAPTGGDYQMNLEYNQNNALGRHVNNLRPELTHSYEMELGYVLLNNLEIVSNVFYTQVNHIFNYSFDENLDDYYVNSKELSTYGMETGLKYKNTILGRFDLNYSFYQTARNTASAYYQATNQNGVVIHPNMNLGFPTHKATLNHTFNFTQDLSFNHNLIFFSDRFGYSGSELTHYKPDWIYNAYFRYQNMPIKGFEIGLGLYDAFNARYQYVQQFNGSHPALPAESRELMLRLSYKF